MIEVPRSLYRASLIAVLAASVFTFGCNKKPKQVTAPPSAPPPPAAAQPTVSLQASPTAVEKGDAATLSWTSTDATQLTIAPDVGTVPAEGQKAVTPAASTTYTITASGPGGSATASARITVATAAPPAPELTQEAIFLKEVRDAYFDFNKADIRGDARTALAQTAQYLRNYPTERVTVEGHCDERGSTEYNLALGDRRASAVKQYLVSLGISADRINTVSFGKEKPFCMQSTEDCYQQNRRGHFVRVTK
ncbi:MAG TPA: peptidoglycan-associated lipoprotein Pal [Candidatus Acidoferrum sp.]|jgi:peptidoglycan-associated lipoprotein